MRFIVLHQPVHIGVSYSKVELIHSVLIVHSDLLDDQTLVVLVQSDPLYKSIYLGVSSKLIYSAAFVERGLFTVRTQVQILVPVDVKFWRPRGRHVKDILQIVLLLRARILIQLLVILIVFVFILVCEHNIFPLKSYFEIDIQLLHLNFWIQVYPEIFIVEDGLYCLIRRLCN